VVLRAIFPRRFTSVAKRNASRLANDRRLVGQALLHERPQFVEVWLKVDVTPLEDHAERGNGRFSVGSIRRSGVGLADADERVYDLRRWQAVGQRVDNPQRILPKKSTVRARDSARSGATTYSGGAVRI
jgi:hypothetical protein